MLQALLDSVVQAAVVSLVAFGLSLTWGIGRFANVAHVQYALIAAYLAVVLTPVLGGLPVAAVIAIAVTAAAGAVIYRFVLRRLARTSASTALIGSLALAIVLQAAVQTFAGSQPQRLPITPAPGLLIGDVIVTRNSIVIAGITAVVLGAIAIVLRFTRFGRAVHFVNSNPDLARASGIDSERIITLVFALAAGLAGLGGVMLAVDTTSNITMGDSLLLPVFAAAIVGSIGRPWGAVAASIGLAMLSNVLLSIDLLGLRIPIDYRPAIGFLALILVLVFRPQGLFAVRSRHA